MYKRQVDGDGAGVGEIIDDDDLVTTLEQLNDGVRADKAGATGNEDTCLLYTSATLPMFFTLIFNAYHQL